MTVASSTSKVSYSGNSSTVVFSVPFYFLENDHLIVIIRDANEDETEQTLNTDYTVSGAGNVAGGSITMTSAPATGETLVISRDVPATQETDYTENDPFPAQSHEQALDKLTMLVQQNAEAIQRALTAPLTDPDTINMIFPPLEERKGKALVFDETTGDPKAGIVPDAYQGADSSDPTERLNGDSLQADDFYFNTSTNKIRIYNGSSWADFDPDQTIEAGDISSGAATDGYVLTADGSGGAAWETPYIEIVQDTTPQLGGDLDTNGNDILFGDNDKAIFGDGGDLEIYHDGTNHIVDFSAGTLKIQSGSEELAAINTAGAGAVELQLGEIQKGIKLSGDDAAGTATMVFRDSAVIEKIDGGLNSKLAIAAIDGTPIQLSGSGGTKYAKFNSSSSIIYHNDDERIETTSTGLKISGGQILISASIVSPQSSAALEVYSVSKGFLPPRLTDSQRDAISLPAAGLMIYNTDTNKLNFYNGSAWRAVDDSAV